MALSGPGMDVTSSGAGCAELVSLPRVSTLEARQAKPHLTHTRAQGHKGTMEGRRHSGWTLFRVGILGLGRGITHLRNFLSLDTAEVVGACDRLPRRRSRRGQDAGSPGRGGDAHRPRAGRPAGAAAGRRGRGQQRAAAGGARYPGDGGRLPRPLRGARGLHRRGVRPPEGGRRAHRRTYMLGENTCYRDFFRYFRKWVAEDRFGPISIAEGDTWTTCPGRSACPTAPPSRPAEARGRGRTDAGPPGGPTSPRSST